MQLLLGSQRQFLLWKHYSYCIILIILLATALIGSIFNRESCTISFIVTFAGYVYLYDVYDSENYILTYVLTYLLTYLLTLLVFPVTSQPWRLARL